MHSAWSNWENNANSFSNKKAYLEKNYNSKRFLTQSVFNKVN